MGFRLVSLPILMPLNDIERPRRPTLPYIAFHGLAV